MADPRDDPDFTPDVGEFIEVLEPSPNARSFRVFEVAIESSVAKELERLAEERGIRPEQLAGVIVSHVLEAVGHETGRPA
jgi:hypothetical protein